MRFTSVNGRELARVAHIITTGATGTTGSAKLSRNRIDRANMQPMSVPDNRRRRPHRDWHENPQHQRRRADRCAGDRRHHPRHNHAGRGQHRRGVLHAGVIIPMMPFALIDSANIVAAMITEMTCA